MSKVLVRFYSASGITRKKARDLANEVEGDLYEITPKQMLI